MKVVIDIQDSHVPFMMELLQSLDYVSILGEENGAEKMRMIEELTEALKDVKAHEQGEKQLKTAKDLLDEL